MPWEAVGAQKCLGGTNTTVFPAWGSRGNAKEVRVRACSLSADLSFAFLTHPLKSVSG